MLHNDKGVCTFECFAATLVFTSTLKVCFDDYYANNTLECLKKMYTLQTEQLKLFLCNYLELTSTPLI